MVYVLELNEFVVNRNAIDFNSCKQLYFFCFTIRSCHAYDLINKTSSDGRGNLSQVIYAIILV
jgi:hypothetical protein